MSSSPPSNQEPAVGSSCNVVSIAFVLATLVFGVLGYQFTSTYGSLAAIGGAIGGVVIGFVATPLVFLLLMILIHIGIKIEDWFRKPRS